MVSRKVKGEVMINTLKSVMERPGKVLWKGRIVTIDVSSFDGYMMFMNMLRDNMTASRNRELFKRKMNDLVLWFNQSYIGCRFDAPMPPTIMDLEIDLFEL